MTTRAKRGSKAAVSSVDTAPMNEAPTTTSTTARRPARGTTSRTASATKQSSSTSSSTKVTPEAALDAIFAKYAGIS